MIEYDYIHTKLELARGNTLLQSFNVVSDFIALAELDGYGVAERVWVNPYYLFTFKRPKPSPSYKVKVNFIDPLF